MFKTCNIIYTLSKFEVSSIIQGIINSLDKNIAYFIYVFISKSTKYLG